MPTTDGGRDLCLAVAEAIGQRLGPPPIDLVAG
jgi:hypothetical protein